MPIFVPQHCVMNRILFSLACCLSLLHVRADEGMWIPTLLEQMNMTDMKARGFKLTAEDIYSVNHSSMKDAVGQFGGGCTSEMISGEGLVLTNHHCGYGQIQSHSSTAHDYLKDGFYAKSRSEELACPGLTVMFIVSMEDVTSRVLFGVANDIPEAARQKAIQKNMEAIEKESTKEGYGAFVRAFYSGNAYYLFITETFEDVRMVFAPPTSIGNFGGDYDNWVWPRHTGDFSMFRIYANKDNKPAKYASTNVPFKPRHFFPISMRGVKPDDFTMVYGFPGRTNEYLSSFGVSLVQHVSDPLKVHLRDKRLKVMEAEMDKDRNVYIKYAAKHNGVSNYWKKWSGEMFGLQRSKAIEKKQNYERQFTERVQKNTDWNNRFGKILPDLEMAYKELEPWQRQYDLMTDGLLSIELLRYMNGFAKLAELEHSEKRDQKEIDKYVAALQKGLVPFYKDFDLTLDKKMAVAMFEEGEKEPELFVEVMVEIEGKKMKDPLRNGTRPEMYKTVKSKYKGNYVAYVDAIYGKSFFSDSAKVRAFLNGYSASSLKKLSKDKGYQLARDVWGKYLYLISPYWTGKSNEVARLNRDYMTAQMTVMADRKFYPDANSTLRVSFGKVEPYSARDGMSYNWFTTLDGIMEKEDPKIDEYMVHPRLKTLWEQKDYGRYADKDGKLHTCFIASNHTTGGNSGSPVLDANGNLIGTNFDRCWEGTMSDINYDPQICRNIVVDVRYTLFVIDKFGGCGYLLNEMKLVE
jgi:hypothetical protein